MPRPSTSLRARLAAAGTATLLAAGLAAVGGGGTAASAAPAAADEDTPLVVSIDRLAPSTITPGEPITVAGTVTNTDDVAWSTINVYPVLGDPLTTEDELADAADSPADDVVGERITEVRDTIAELGPGESADYRLRIPGSLVSVTEPAVYWFGVHTLGTSEDTPQDGYADGRARTFLPLVADQQPTSDRPGSRLPNDVGSTVSVPTALVLPLRRYVDHRPNGSLAHPRTWTRSMIDGSLDDLLQVGEAADGRPLSWLVDPAVLDAVRRLARGNPGRSLAPTLPPGDQGDDAGGGDSSASPDAGSSDDGSGTDDADPEFEAAADDPETRVAQEWLDRLGRRLQDDDVLALPFGDVDVPAVVEHRADLLDLAVDRSSRLFSGLGVEPTPVVAPPDGTLDESSLAAVPRDSLVLLGDRSFDTGDATPAVLDHADHTVVAASTAAASGGPGPGDPLDPVALRQRILSEAALRLIASEAGADTDPEPLVVTLPDDLDAESAAAFFAGLDVDWVDLTSLDDVARSGPTGGSGGDGSDRDPALVYPSRAALSELDAGTVDAAADLVDAGATLQDLLTRNDVVGDVVADQALTSVSFEARTRDETNRRTLDASEDWIARRLAGVRISAPPGVTLSSDSGELAVTVTNRLDQPVTVGVAAQSDEGVRVEPSGEFELGPGSRTTVLLQAEASEVATHNVTLRVVDGEGRPLGSTDSLAIRSAQVSDVIWLIIGTGIGLLFLAIVVRLVRRVRAARGRDDDGPGSAPDDPDAEPADEPLAATSGSGG